MVQRLVLGPTAFPREKGRNSATVSQHKTSHMSINSFHHYNLWVISLLAVRCGRACEWHPGKRSHTIDSRR